MEDMLKCLICAQNFPVNSVGNGPAHDCSGEYRSDNFAWKLVQVPTPDDPVDSRPSHEWIEDLLKEAAANGPPVYPNAFYNPDGDMLEVRLNEKHRFAKRIDNLLTVYYTDDDDNEIVGYDIKNISRLMPRLERGLPVLDMHRMD